MRRGAFFFSGQEERCARNVDAAAVRGTAACVRDATPAPSGTAGSCREAPHFSSAPQLSEKPNAPCAAVTPCEASRNAGFNFPFALAVANVPLRRQRGGAKRSRGRGAEQPGRQPRAPGGVALPRPAPPRPAGVGSSAAGRLPAAGRRSLPSLPAVPLLPPASAAALAGRALRSLSQEISVTELPGRGGEAQLCLHVLCSDRIRCDPRSRSSRSHDGGQGLSFLPFRQEGELCLGSADGDQPS